MARRKDLYLVFVQKLNGGADCKCAVVDRAYGVAAAESLTKWYRTRGGADASLYYWYQAADSDMPLNLGTDAEAHRR